ncbi:CcoQ/FixQ family Cbb3-type cytochrome c oxidase assembly chaperone [Lamprobacter modestohalophilus]|uniref:CcoQ/FixQ family Cbb3-type cytochrome c oxidase assembly chaperone n=1 Tax=Lamprobacter modestohalophilus TaxID=1064514 RepID=A0A9X1B6P4_9GAMM|nr:CcoQ/FixQ family Cbb3-type cytochrome c oxidase assembly chaperone [Lamprobacter modestohalophilus]MCF7977339.1 cbb3-type cytochrome c oxidase subunit 3 [Chromatiaceae bacterium]MCF7996801.1 cbb3-type cytochrome c oxidase subunit 3 [Chromatiaceae bacterium]MCF8014376.1 cbb3-type cytochrome c oxidase subunit 3 [Chromatiaceae bacterium]
MSSLSDYFETDWAAMTASDWVGTILTVVIFVLMVVAYFQVFRPKNRDKLEAKRHIPFEDDHEDLGDNDGRP